MPRSSAAVQLQRRVLREPTELSLIAAARNGDERAMDEIAKRGWTVDPVSGEDLQALAKEVTSQPPEVVEWLKKLLAK